MDDPGLAEVQVQGGVLAGNLGYQSSPKSSPDFAIFTNIIYTHCDKICVYIDVYIYIYTQENKSV